MDHKTRARIVKALRIISQGWGPKCQAKTKARVAPATYQCEKCETWVYEGQSSSNYVAMSEEHPDKKLIREMVHLDHIDPVVPMEGWRDSRDFTQNVIDRVFTEEENFSVLCQICHKEKTKQESAMRAAIRQERKKK